MHLSYSEDILQRIRAQQSLSNTMNTFIRPHNPEPYNPHRNRNSSHIEGSRIHQSALTPIAKKPIVYNEYISEDENKNRGRYRLKNFRQNQLKINDPMKIIQEKLRSTSYNGLKQLMREELDRSSLKKRYEEVIRNADFDVVQKLKSQLLFLPGSVKVPHKNRYRPNKRQSIIPSNKITVNGNKIEDDKKSPEKEIEINLSEFPSNYKRTAGYELKYRRNYLEKQTKTPALKRKNELEKEKEEEPGPPLTGWGVQNF